MPQSGDDLQRSRHAYAFGPFNFFSDVELSGLPEAAATGIPIRVMVGVVPVSLAAPTFSTHFCSVTASEFVLHVPEVASYCIRQGKEITIAPAPGASPLDVRGFLLGNIFAILCHQRRLLPLHASAVRMGSGVVAFLGESGAGKSTLAAFLADSGYPLVADDICLMDPTAPLSMRVLPVAPWLKLWRSSLEALGRDVAGLARTFSDEDKFRLPVSHFPLVAGSHLPLRAVVILKRAADAGFAAEATLVPLRAVQAVTQMMEFTYQPQLLDWLGLKGEHFTSCAAALEHADSFVCTRPWSFAAQPAVLACLTKAFGC